jgi:hypothetical protein
MLTALSAAPSTVLQCDVNQVPDTPFSLCCPDTSSSAPTSQAPVSFAGQTTFYTCLADASTGTHNIYVLPDQGAGCAEVTLLAEGECVANACASPDTDTPSPAPEGDGTPTPEGDTPEDVDTPSSVDCSPLTLAPAFEFPHLILPVSSSSPDAPTSTSFDGTLAPGSAVLFSFDIPPGAAGKTCHLVFLLPQLADLETSSYSISGSGAVSFARLAGAPTEGQSWNSAPAVADDYGVTTLVAGNGYAVAEFACPAGEAAGFRMAVADDGDTCFDWFQDYNPSPLGLYITVC